MKSMRTGMGCPTGWPWMSCSWIPRILLAFMSIFSPQVCARWTNLTSLFLV